MPYLGSEPAVGFASTTKQAFSGDASAVAFTLTRAASVATDLEVFVDNVQQEPTTAFGVSGTTLTFTAAPATGTNNIYVVHRQGGASATSIENIATDLSFKSDGTVLKFGADSDITLTHVADTGLNIKNINTGDNKPVILTLQTGETDLAANEVIGKIAFQSPDEGTGTDAILVSAAIQAIAEGNHSSSSNATSLQFMTGASEAATSKMVLSSGGNLTIAGDLTVNGDTATFESANSTDPRVIIKNTTNDANAAVLNFIKDKGANGADDDSIGSIFFTGDNDAQQQTLFGRINGLVETAADGQEGGKIQLQVATHDGEMKTGFEIFDGSAEDEIDVNIGQGLASLTTIAGTVGVRVAAASAVALTVKSTGNTDSALVVQQTGNTDGWGLTPDNTNGNLDFVRIGGGAGTYFRIGVDGSLSTPTLGTSNLRLGVNAGNSILSGGNFNVCVGDEAGTAITTGDNNVAVGYAALDKANTGQYNVGVGTECLTDLTTGSFNTAVGDGAGANIIGANSNTSIGAGSLFTNSTGASNTVVGRDAGRENTTGGQNVCVGESAGRNSTTTDRSVFIGDQAGKGISGTKLTGNGNVAVGPAAGLVLQGTAGDNAYVGAGTGAANTTGSSNSALGADAGPSITTGSNNVCVGHDAGRSGSPGGAITTQSNNLFLGDENIDNAAIQVDWSVASDQRDKTDFTALDLGLDFVKALAPVTYKWDKRSKYGDKYADDYDLLDQTPDGTHKEDWLDIGFKAQEVEVLEQAAGYNKSNKTNLVSKHTGDGKQMTLQYSKFVPVLVKALQELSEKVDTLQSNSSILEQEAGYHLDNLILDGTNGSSADAGDDILLG